MQVYSFVFLRGMGFAAFESFLHFLKLQPLLPVRLKLKLLSTDLLLLLDSRLAAMIWPLREVFLFLLGCFVTMFIYQKCRTGHAMLFGPRSASVLLDWARDAVQPATQAFQRDDLAVVNDDLHQNKGITSMRYSFAIVLVMLSRLRVMTFCLVPSLKSSHLHLLQIPNREDAKVVKRTCVCSAWMHLSSLVLW
jgi:hypothetical protein